MPELRTLRIQLATIGAGGMVSVALRHRLRRPLRIGRLVESALAGKRGLEIGGPSAVFARGGLLPIYPTLASLDNCDFGGDTLWHGAVADGSPYRYDAERAAGTHFIRDATDLAGMADASYDAVVSSHTLEHVANPLRALAEWSRVIGSAGHVLVVVPHAEHTVDRSRPLTTLEHIEQDYEQGTREDDDTHVQEFVELADLDVDPERLTRDAFRVRTTAFASNRAIHHHVFDTRLVVQLFDRAGYRVLGVDTALPFHIVVLARAPGGDTGGNDAFLSPDAAWVQHSVFRRDRIASGSSATSRR